MYEIAATWPLELMPGAERFVRDWSLSLSERGLLWTVLTWSRTGKQITDRLMLERITRSSPKDIVTVVNSLVRQHYLKTDPARYRKLRRQDRARCVAFTPAASQR